MKKNVILHIINSTVFSGLESVVCDIIQNLNEQYEFIYVTKYGSVIEILKEKNVKYEIIKSMSCKEIKRVAKKYNPQIIHTHDYKASCICSLAKINYPIISHLHNNNCWIKTIHPYSFLYLYCSKKFNKILTVSESIENEYIFSKFINKKIENISNPVSREKILNQVDIKDYQKKYDICCVARLSKSKNPFKFLEIINKIKQEKKNIKVVWVGDGELKDKFIHKIKKLNIENNIDVVGFQKNPYKYIANSKVFLLTSNWEGYGLVAFEALTLGLPCVVSNVGGLSNIVDNECGFLSNIEEELVKNCLLLLNNQEVYNKKKNNALLKSTKLDNLKEYINSIEEKYKELIN